MKRKSKGFTLVELIVVLVILAILAAILIPALLGYIDRAKESQYMLSAQSVMKAAQASFSEAYAYGSVAEAANLDASAMNGDTMLKGTDFAKKILETADDEPYMVIVGTGDYNTYSKKNKVAELHKAFTVYFVAYWPTQKEDPIFFNGTTWTKEYPWKSSGANTFNANGEDIKMQFHILSGPYKGTSANWNHLKSKLGVS